MHNKKLIVALVGSGLCATLVNARGGEVATLAGGPEQPRDQIAPLSEHNSTISTTSNFKVSSLIGMTVRNDAGERLGSMQDIIVNMDSRTLPFAIIERGGTLGIGQTRTAARWRIWPGRGTRAS